ncbi:MAG: DUF177 domain-containing protein [Acidobacteriaceae bacterium]|nr:DUF177 domain-containing protein [Acidobacteriaceae bacterium]MBV8572620.1 DUF177 domain-containing protein [Acidobacteriaceae bacterium]
MFIGLRELELQTVRFDVDVPPGEIDYDAKLTQDSVLHAEGTAQLISQSLGEIRVSGDLKTTMQGTCDRCLEAARFPVSSHFDLVYLPSGGAASGGEDEVDEAAVEVGYYEGSGLDLNDILREVVLLALPMQMVCSEECKGICPLCGQNRNQQECDCHLEAVDDRWSKLKAFRSETGQPQTSKN